MKKRRNKLPIVRIRKSKQNPDFWEVTQNGRVMTRHMSKKMAQKTAAARRNVLKKRRKRQESAKSK